MIVSYVAVSSVTQTKNGGFMRDVVIEFYGEKFYVVLYSDNLNDILPDHGEVDIDLSRLLRAKLVRVKKSLTTSPVDVILKSKTNKEV